jgi:predicted DNA-binding protein YlxM (UPF0122 family)
MEWDADKLNAFIHHFGLSINNMAKSVGISKDSLYNLKYGAYSFDKYNGRLTAYCKAVKAGKRKELEKMIEYYESFEA